MKQKKLSMVVNRPDGSVLYECSTASLDSVASALHLFAEIGTVITLTISEVELSAIPNTEG